MEAMDVIDVYNHPGATIVELEDRYEFFGGRNCRAFIPGKPLDTPAVPYKELFKANLNSVIERMIRGEA